MSATRHDLVVIGGGPGGYVAAIRAAQLGLDTVLVEREHLGGICLNWGCIPTKALLRSAELYHLLGRTGQFGLKAEAIGFDIRSVVTRSRSVAEQLARGVAYLLKKNKVRVLDGHGRLAGKGTVHVEKDGAGVAELAAPHIVLAPGARARTVPGIEPDGKHVWTYKDAMVPEVMPKSILVIGAGAIGMEFASFYRALGAEVTVVEVLPRVLPLEDEEISTLAQRAFKKRGIHVHTGATITALERSAAGVAAAIDLGGGKQASVTAERAIVSVGIAGNVEDLGIEGTAVQVEKGHVKVDPWCATAEPGVYAIGDVAGPPWLAHKASREGVLCVERIAGLADVRPLDPSRIPACTYSMPQVASVGLTEARAAELGRKTRIGRFSLTASGKAVALGEPEGLVKTVFDADTGELLGVHMIGAEVTELIQGPAIAMTLETTEAELMRTVFAHPTLSEAVHESVLAAFGRAVHA